MPVVGQSSPQPPPHRKTVPVLYDFRGDGSRVTIQPEVAPAGFPIMVRASGSACRTNNSLLIRIRNLSYESLNSPCGASSPAFFLEVDFSLAADLPPFLLGLVASAAFGSGCEAWGESSPGETMKK